MGLFSCDRVQGRSAKDAHTANDKLTVVALFVNFRAALEGAQCCGIRAVIPPVLPPGLGKFVCEIQRAPFALPTPYAKLLKFPEREGIYVSGFV
jgi:hypothetical protein